jgi:type IV pilus assembly protein PilE
MKSGFSRGFTLVELLVVISIIGILTTFVLVSVSTANKRGKDASVQSNLSEVRAQAQLFYNTNSSYCLASGTCPTTMTSNDCKAASNANLVFGDPKILVQTVAAEANNVGTLICNVTADGADYVIQSKLSDGATYYCIDSNGIGSRSTTAITNTSTECP